MIRLLVAATVLAVVIVGGGRDERVPVQILRHPTTRLVGQVTRAQVAGDLAAWTNLITGKPELLPADERVRAAMAAMIDSGALVLDDTGKLTAPVEGERC